MGQKNVNGRANSFWTWPFSAGGYRRRRCLQCSSAALACQLFCCETSLLTVSRANDELCGWTTRSGFHYRMAQHENVTYYGILRLICVLHVEHSTPVDVKGGCKIQSSKMSTPEVFLFCFSFRAANEKAPKERLWGEESRACYCLPSLHACVWETEMCGEKFKTNFISPKSIDFQECTNAYWCVTLTIWAEGHVHRGGRERAKSVRKGERGAWLAAMRMSLGLAVKCRPASIFLKWSKEQREQQRTCVCGETDTQQQGRTDRQLAYLCLIDFMIRMFG